MKISWLLLIALKYVACDVHSSTTKAKPKPTTTQKGNPTTEMASTLTSVTMVTNVTNNGVTSGTGVTNITTTEMKTQEGDKRTTSMTSAVPSTKVSTKEKRTTSTEVSKTDKGTGTDMPSTTVSTQQTPSMSQKRIMCFNCTGNHANHTCAMKQEVNKSDVAFCDAGQKCWTAIEKEGDKLTKITRDCILTAKCPTGGNEAKTAKNLSMIVKCCNTDHCNKDANSAVHMMHNVAILLTGYLLANVLPY